jgi:hypothetical protein
MKPQPLFVTEATAADLFDLPRNQFSLLVLKGHLPPAKTIGDHRLYDVEELVAWARGEKGKSL